MSVHAETPQTKNIYSTELVDVLHFHAKEYRLYRGLSEEHVKQLQKYSVDLSDTELQNATSDYERFGCGSYEVWFLKGRTPYALVDSEFDALAAIIWFGPKTLGRPSLKHLSESDKAAELRHVHGDWHTSSYRAYGQYRGKGLMRTSVERAIKDYKVLFPHARLWLSIDSKNEASKKLAQKLGFIEDAELSDPSRHHYVYMYSHHG